MHALRVTIKNLRRLHSLSHGHDTTKLPKSSSGQANNDRGEGICPQYLVAFAKHRTAFDSYRNDTPSDKRHGNVGKVGRHVDPKEVRVKRSLGRRLSHPYSVSARNSRGLRNDSADERRFRPTSTRFANRSSAITAVTSSELEYPSGRFLGRPVHDICNLRP